MEWEEGEESVAGCYLTGTREIAKLSPSCHHPAWAGPGQPIGCENEHGLWERCLAILGMCRRVPGPAGFPPTPGPGAVLCSARARLLFISPGYSGHGEGKCLLISPLLGQH